MAATSAGDTPPGIPQPAPQVNVDHSALEPPRVIALVNDAQHLENGIAVGVDATNAPGIVQVLAPVLNRVVKFGAALYDRVHAMGMRHDSTLVDHEAKLAGLADRVSATVVFSLTVSSKTKKR